MMILSGVGQENSRMTRLHYDSRMHQTDLNTLSIKISSTRLVKRQQQRLEHEFCTITVLQSEVRVGSRMIMDVANSRASY